MSVYASQELVLDWKVKPQWLTATRLITVMSQNRESTEHVIYIVNRNSRCKTPSDIFTRLYVTLYIKHSNRMSIFVIRKLTSFLNSNTTCGFYTLTRAFEGKPRQGFFL